MDYYSMELEARHRHTERLEEAAQRRRIKEALGERPPWYTSLLERLRDQLALRHPPHPTDQPVSAETH